MNTRRNEAYKLRIQGWSYNEINAELGIPKSTLSTWFKRTLLSDAATARLKAREREGGRNALIRRNKLQTVHAQKRALEIRRGAEEMIYNLGKRELWLVGIALYWGEGYKRPRMKDGRHLTCHTVSFVNSDEQMVRIFIRFLRECLDVPTERIRASMRLYPHISESAALKFWQGVSGLPTGRFFKTTYLVSGASKRLKPFNRLPWGTLQIEVNDTQKFYEIMGWIDGMKKGL